MKSIHMIVNGTFRTMTIVMMMTYIYIYICLYWVYHVVGDFSILIVIRSNVFMNALDVGSCHCRRPCLSQDSP
jgi:hypothetical protein